MTDNPHYRQAASDITDAHEGKGLKASAFSLASAAVHALLYVGQVIEAAEVSRKIDRDFRR